MIARSPVDSASNGGASHTLGITDLVVDAGVAIKWYIPEIHEHEAKRFLDPGLHFACSRSLFFRVWQHSLEQGPTVEGAGDYGRGRPGDYWLVVGTLVSGPSHGAPVDGCIRARARSETRERLRLLLPRPGVCARLSSGDCRQGHFTTLSLVVLTAPTCSGWRILSDWGCSVTPIAAPKTCSPLR